MQAPWFLGQIRYMLLHIRPRSVSLVPMPRIVFTLVVAMLLPPTAVFHAHELAHLAAYGRIVLPIAPLSTCRNR